MAMDKLVIGKRIRHEREKLAMTRDEFAEQVEISPQFLAEIENGTKGMSAETLYKICEKISLPADYILLGRQSVGTLRTPAAEILSSIPPRYSGAVEDMLRTFAQVISIAEQHEEEP